MRLALGCGHQSEDECNFHKMDLPGYLLLKYEISKTTYPFVWGASTSSETPQRPSQNWLRVIHRSCERNLSYLSMKCISALVRKYIKAFTSQSMVTTRTGKSTEEYRHQKRSRHPRGGVKCATCFRAEKTERELIALEKHCQTWPNKEIILSLSINRRQGAEKAIIYN